MQWRAFAKLIRRHGDQGIKLGTSAEPDQKHGRWARCGQRGMLTPSTLCTALCRRQKGSSRWGSARDGYEARATHRLPSSPEKHFPQACTFWFGFACWTVWSLQPNTCKTLFAAMHGNLSTVFSVFFFSGCLGSCRIRSVLRKEKRYFSQTVSKSEHWKNCVHSNTQDPYFWSILNQKRDFSQTSSAVRIL